MKKFLNKKTLAAAILAVALVATALGTYAVWVIGLEPKEPDDMNMAVLDYDVNGGFMDMDAGFAFTPGSRWDYEAQIYPTVHNTMPFIARVTLAEPVTTIVNGPTTYPNPGWQNDGDKYGKYNPLAKADYWTIPNDPNVIVDFNEDWIGYGGYQSTDDWFQWYLDSRPGQENKYYIAIWGNPTFDYEGVEDIAGVPVIFDAKTNEDVGLMYMGALISFQENWIATQLGSKKAYDEAFGVGVFDALEEVTNYIEVHPRDPRPFSLEPYQSITAEYIQEKVASLADK